jgi:hypothetical protein
VGVVAIGFTNFELGLSFRAGAGPNSLGTGNIKVLASDAMNVVDIKGAVPPLVIINGFTHIPSVLPALRRRYSQQ